MSLSIPRKKFYLALILILVVVLFGVTGYRLIENFSWLDSVYMTIITVGTVGFREVSPLSDAGKIFTIFLIISSIGIFAYSVSFMAIYVIEARLLEALKGRKYIKALRKMKNHVIICGFGRNGQQTALELKAYGLPFVVIEKSQEVISNPEFKDIVFVEGDSTDDEVLMKAQPQQAHSLITTLPIDADNLYVVLAAKALNPALQIISRATSDFTYKKLRTAGASHVVMPEKVGGVHMASLVAKPDVVEFFFHLSIHGNNDVNLEEVICSDLPEKFQNKTIHELSIRRLSGANIVGYKTPSGEFIINPPPDTRMIKNSKLFVIGTQQQINQMRELIKESAQPD